MDKAKLRSEVCKEFESLTIGPRSGEDEFVEGARGVTLRYLTGILFPRGQKRNDLAQENDSFSDETSNEANTPRDDFSGDQDNPLSMANEELPSCVGISFVVKKSRAFSVTCEAARYLHTSKKIGEVANAAPVGFQRRALPTEIINSIEIEKTGRPVFEGRANLQVIRRSSTFRPDCDVVTVSLVNNQEQNKKGKASKENIEKRLYQVKLRCESSETIQPYESTSEIGTNLEERILALQYSENPIYAVGHGASVNWLTPGNKGVKWVEISYLPREVVNRPLFDRLQISDSDAYTDRAAFDICRLADPETDQALVIKDLYSLCDFYDKWIKSQCNLRVGKLADAEDYLISEMENCSSRMRDGIAQLASTPGYWEAFVLANRAMLYQIDQNARLKRIRASREKEKAGLASKLERANRDAKLGPA